MEYMLAFSTPMQGTGERYDRHDQDKTWIWGARDRSMIARLYTGYSGAGMIPAKGMLVKPVRLKLVSIESGTPVDVLLGPDSVPLVNAVLPTYIWNPAGQPDGWVAAADGSILCAWTIKKGAMTLQGVPLPDGIYYVTSTAGTTLQFPIIVNALGAGGVPVVATKLLAQPVYMSIGYVSGWPQNRNTRILDYPGIRVGSSAPKVPFLDGGTFSAPFVHTTTRSEMYSEAMAVSLQEYDGYQWPTETPVGGPFLSTVQRYIYSDYARPNPTLDARNATLTCSAPNDKSAGDSQTSSLGVCPSVYQLANKDFIVLEASGRIVRISFQTRDHTTLYGWEKIPGTAQARMGAQIPVGAARLAWYRKYFRFIGTGPDIARAWQMRPSVGNEMYAWVADPTNHVILGIDLTTGVATVIAGILGVGGYADGGAGVAKFDQPRGVVEIQSGQYAGMLVVGDEHNSAYRLVNPETGIVTTLSRALRVPAIFSGANSDFKRNIAIDRANWGATADVQQFGSAQFVHPTQMDVMSDGKTIICGHHDELQIFKVDLDARTLTVLYSAPTVINNNIVLAGNWPTVNVDRTGALGIKDGIYVCHWHANSEVVLHPNGTKHLFFNSSQASPGDGPGIGNDAYPRLLAPMPDGSLIVHGDGHTRISRVRKIRPDDPPTRNEIRFRRGEKLYRSDGINYRCSVMAINGAQGRNMLAGYLTPGELAMLEFDARKAYMLAKFKVSDWTDQDHLDVAYYLDLSDPVGVALIRGNIQRPRPIPEQPLSFAAAMLEVSAGATVERLGNGTRISPHDLHSIDWVIVPPAL